MPTQRQNDERWMGRALELSRHGEGLTRPNPPVGAVLVRRGRVVGEGYHRRAGGPHAEIVALRQAGPGARGATLYVTLEPCSTWGRTPPCTDAVLASGVRRVVVSARDPNPRHAGRGIRLLRRAGLRVDVGVLAGEGAALVAPFAKWVTTGLPFVTVKLGMTVDGKIADAAGVSRWITGPAARRQVQALRRRADAVLVGYRTAALDNPSLLPVPSLGRQPLRVVVDGHGRLRLRSRVFSDGLARRTLVATTRASSSAYRTALLDRGVAVAVLPGSRGRIDLAALLRELGRREVLHVLCEGGGELAASLVRAGLVDEYQIFVAPKLLGGRATAAVGGAGWPLAKAPRLRFVEVARTGDDIFIRAVPETSW